MTDQPRTSARDALHKFLVIHRHLHRYARQVSSQGIRPAQLSVLLFLLENGPATISGVQDYLYSSPSTASTIISQLEDAGYVTRTRSQEDNRVVNVAITAAGREVVEATPQGGLILLRRQLTTLSEERLVEIDEVLAELMALMEITDNV